MYKEEIEKEFVIIDEGVVSSVIKDFVSFGVLMFVLWFNYARLGNQWLVTLFILIIFTLVALAKSASKSIHRFNSIDEAINFLKEKKNE